ncbi:MAG: hypothetical protein RLZ98_497 [Pseudomonadota bacterium]|jgi:hypothetical protein
MINRIVAGLAGLLALLAVNAAAVAAPLSSPQNTAVVADTLVQKAHGCHRDIRMGAAGPHSHRGPNCRRVAAGGPRPGYGYGPRRRGFCRDVRTCRYVGPIKRCRTRTVCN